MRVFVEKDELGLVCPSCGQRGLTRDQKLNLPPLYTVPCGRCGVPLSVSWRGAAVILSPMVVALVALLVSKASPLGLMLASACVVLGYVLINFRGLRVPMAQRTRARPRS